ncbi:IS3 family transposase|uniref:IS3 family transposase n=1 Tax=Dendrosporobacter quercicolus TaxID=146817 RepID=UPI000B8195B3|nr:IS3 family transposase [Dendrosporobacter quercicolus DSM 1736]
MEQAHLIRSMSKKGCSPDNSACESFFGRLKNEMFYGISWAGVTVETFRQRINAYMEWYRKERIKMSLGAMSPIEYRQSLGLVA